MMTAEAARAPRHLTLDAIRGVAVMGILLMNVIAFTMPEQAYVNPIAWGGTTLADLSVWAVNFVLVDGKMRGLFSLLFGASMLLVVDRAEAKGESAASVHYRRMVWLLLFGLAHYYLVWFGDILVTYAAIGAIAFLFRGREAVNLVKWGIIFIALGFFMWLGILGSMYLLQFAANAPGADPATVAEHRALMGAMGAPGSKDIARELAIYRGGYAGIFEYRTEDGFWGPVATALMFAFDTLGLMLLGMALLRNGFLTGDWAPERYRAIALRCYAIGLAGMIPICAWCILSGFDLLTLFGAAFVWSTPFRVLLVVAHAALAILLIRRFAGTALVARIAATGRAAFSNYLGTSIVMTTLFYGYGLGLFGTISRAGIYLFVFGVWALMLLWSKSWLDRFAYGPLEWLWRSLARGKLQPMQKATSAA